MLRSALTFCGVLALLSGCSLWGQPIAYTDDAGPGPGGRDAGVTDVARDVPHDQDHAPDGGPGADASTPAPADAGPSSAWTTGRCDDAGCVDAGWTETEPA